MTTLDIQRRLRSLGFDPGPLDGVRGRLTIAAIKAFQARSGLEPDGLAGPRTRARLFPDAADVAGQSSPPWFEEATRLQGLREAKGSGSNPAILDWADTLDLPYGEDSIPWCGLFVAHCIAVALPEEPLPGNPLAARDWLRFGRPSQPSLGAVLVFWRGRKSGWQGHVGFCAGEDADAFHVLGGNQADSVSIARLAKTRLLGARWPRTGPAPAAETVVRAATTGLSTDEA